MTKKVLIFSNSYYPKHIGGAEIAIKEITDRIPSQEIEFHMITNRFDAALPKVERIGNILVHRIGLSVRNVDVSRTHHPLFYLEKIFFIPLACFVALRLHRRYHYDGMWAMMVYMVFPIVLLRFFGVTLPYVLTLQEGDSYEHVFQRPHIVLFSPLLKSGIRHATVIQTISHFLSEWPRKMGTSAPIKVVPNAVDVRHFARTYSNDELDELRKKVGKKEGDTFLITTSRLVHKNGIDTVIEALPLLPERVHFVICGTGPDEHMLRTLAERLLLRERVHFMGHIDHSEMPKYLKACDIFIRPSRTEGMGNSFVEAMAAGLPVIGTQVGGIADFLFDEKRNPGKVQTGWAVDVEDPKDIRDAIMDIERDPLKAMRVREHAQSMVEKHYSWDLVAKSMRENIFSVLLSSAEDRVVS